jgi:hypothetical protein
VRTRTFPRNQMTLWRALGRDLAAKSAASSSPFPKVVVVDLRSDLSLALKAVESALATAKATERRAATLLALAKASPELLQKAGGIYVRAGERVRKLQVALEKATGELGGGEGAS